MEGRSCKETIALRAAAEAAALYVPYASSGRIPLTICFANRFFQLWKSRCTGVARTADDSTAAFLGAIGGHRFENIYVTDIFAGLRRGELCGLAWDCVDFKSGTILVNKQRKTREKAVKGEDSHILLMSPKNDKSGQVSRRRSWWTF